MHYRYYFCEYSYLRLIKFLKENNVHYMPDNVKGDGELISFSLLSNIAEAKEILRKLEDMNVGTPLVFAEYSTEEIKTAKLLVMTPKKQCIDIINREEAYQYYCEYATSLGIPKVKHEEQIGLFSIKKEPSMKTKTAFWAEDTGFAEIFTDYRVCRLVNENMLSGIEFKNVLNKNGIYSEKLYQMTSSNVIDSKFIGKGYGERKEICQVCGREQYFIDNTYQLHLDFSGINFQNDLYMTERIFGEGIAYPLYIISQDFYQLLKKNKLDGGITVSPVAEITK